MPCLCNAVIIHSLLMQQDNNSPRTTFVCAALYRQIQPRQIITYCQQMLRTLRTVRVRRNLTAEARDMDMNEVTREEPGARLGTIESRIDARFAEVDAKEEGRFAKAEAKSDVRLRKPMPSSSAGSPSWSNGWSSQLSRPRLPVPRYLAFS
jgi:hypothetical protein